MVDCKDPITEYEPIEQNSLVLSNDQIEELLTWLKESKGPIHFGFSRYKKPLSEMRIFFAGPNTPGAFYFMFDM